MKNIIIFAIRILTPLKIAQIGTLSFFCKRMMPLFVCLLFSHAKRGYQEKNKKFYIFLIF